MKCKICKKELTKKTGYVTVTEEECNNKTKKQSKYYLCKKCSHKTINKKFNQITKMFDLMERTMSDSIFNFGYALH